VSCVWAGRWHPDFAAVREAAAQYLTWQTFSARTLARNWAAFAFAGVAVLALTTLARLLGRAMLAVVGAPGDRTAAGVTASVLGLGLLGSCGLALGLTGLLFAPSPLQVGLLALALLALEARRAGGRASASLRRATVRVASADRESVVAAACLSAGALVVVGGLMNIEMVTWDPVTYHLRLPALYMLRHKLYDVWHNHYAFFPAQVEMVFTFAKMMQGDMAVHLITAWIALVLFRASGSLAVAVGAGWTVPLVLLIGSPLVLALSSYPFVDLGLALFAVIAIREWLAWCRTGSSAALLRGALCAGFAMGTKYVEAIPKPC
jgi:hypothetical protein